MVNKPRRLIDTEFNCDLISKVKLRDVLLENGHEMPEALESYHGRVLSVSFAGNSPAALQFQRFELGTATHRGETQPVAHSKIDEVPAGANGEKRQVFLKASSGLLEAMIAQGVFDTSLPEKMQSIENTLAGGHKK